MRASAVSLLCCAVLLAAGCGQPDNPVPPRPTVTPESSAITRTPAQVVIDGMGRSVSLGQSIGRAVALSPSAAEFAAALGLDVVGRSSDTPQAVAPSASVVGSSLAPDFTAVAALEPDIVLADATYHSGRTRDFDRFPFPVYVLRATTYTEVLASIASLGHAVGRDDAARRALDDIRTREASARAHAAGPVPRVLILTGGGRDVFAGSPGTYLGSLLVELGAENVTPAASEGGPVPGFGVIDVTQAATLAPDVVLVLSSGEGGLVARILAAPAWANTPAVTRRRVIDVDTMLFLRSPGPRVGEALEVLAAILWP